MDPPPLPPLPTTITPVPATTVATMQLHYSESVDSSPRSRTDASDDPLPPVPGAKLRLMCSYGGHIIPRPHDKSLCYVGGETRLVVVDRNSSLSTFSSRLSRTLLGGRTFTLKYQLPSEDLDSLVSVATDEDLENMIEEYDRITTSPSVSSSASSRIRLFLFFTKPETAASMGSLLDDAKSESWFVDALNGTGLIPRVLSDSATMGCLMNLDGDLDQPQVVETENKDVKNTNVVQDVQHYLPDSPIVETSSSFGSSSSSPSMANLPPIRVRLEDPKIGIDEQFAQTSLATSGQRQDDMSAQQPPLLVASATNVYGENLNRVSSDERLDQTVSTGFRRKPPLPLQPLPHKASAAGYNLPSPNSVTSDSSIASASSLSKNMHQQDQVLVDARGNTSPNIEGDISVQSSQIHIQQNQDPGYVLPPKLDQRQQQQFVHASMHYIQHPQATTPAPVSSYYQMYAPQTHPIEHQYPVYVMPVPQPPQPYISMQPNITETTAAATSRPLATPNPTILAAPVAYNPPKPAPEMAASVYRTAVTSNPIVQIPAANQYTQQYAGFSQIQHPPQSIATASYGYEYNANPAHDQGYYVQHQAAAPLPPQYQTMTPAAAAVAMADASNQLATDNTTTSQQFMTSQPL